MSRNLYILNPSPSPENNTSNKPKKGFSESVSKFTIPWPYMIVGILSQCYDFFPFPLPCTNRYVQHMAQLGILSHFWNIPPSTFQCIEQIWTNGVNWHVDSESSIFFALPTLQNNMLNQQHCHLKSFLKFTRPSILQGNTFNIWNQLGILSHV